MNFRVVWRERIQARMNTAVFLSREHGRSPKPLFEAMAEAERLLSDDPAQAGESRGERERVLIVPPLSVKFEVFEVSRIVLVYEVVLYPRWRM